MVTAAILGGLALVLMQLSKQQTEQTVASNISNDMAQLKTQIQSYLLAPSHCNANFYNVTNTSSGSPYQPAGGIATCGPLGTASTDSCLGTSAVVPNTIKKSNTTDDWSQATGTKRVRVTGVDLWVDNLVPPSGTSVVSTGYMKVTFQSKLFKPNPTYPSGVKTDQVLYKTPVVWNGSRVTGCPKSWNSTVIYCGILGNSPTTGLCCPPSGSCP